jgi:hypothetical protein
LETDVKNITLNFGGLIGGLMGLGVGVSIIYWKGDTEGRIGKLITVCVCGGAIAGNYLWGLAFPADGEA